MLCIKLIEWLIENIFTKYSLLTKGQASRFEILRNGICNKISRVESLEDFTKQNSILVDQVVPNYQNYSKSYVNNWIIGFLNGEVSFTYATKKNRLIPVIALEHTDGIVIKMIKDLLDIGPNVIERTRGTRKTTYRLYISSKKRSC